MAEHETQENARKEERKPFKVCGPSRKYKGVVAGSLSELKAKACRSLKLQSVDNLIVCLDEDGTEVDDDDYFQFLPEQSKLVILPKSGVFRQGSSADVASLERSESQILHANDVTDGAFSLDPKLRNRINTDPTFFVSLNDEDLEKVVSLDSKSATRELGKSEDEVMVYQESCERELHRRSELRDATELLKLYHTVISSRDEKGSKRSKQS